MSSAFARLEDVVLDPQFPPVDLALRRGRHIGRDDGAAYAFLVDALEHLEPFYRRFACDLIHRSDGWFHLLPTGEELGRRHLSVAEMLVGQTLALLYLDPATVSEGGRVQRELLLARLAGLVGTDTLVRLLSRTRKRRDERVAQEMVRGKITEAIRRLAALGFVDVGDDDRLQLRPAVLRFADPVRGLDDPAAALARLVAQGEAMMIGEATETKAESAEEPDEEEP